MAMKIAPATIKRLAFAKYLFSLGIDRSAASELKSAASLLAFHDSIEIFLQVASEHLNVSVGKSEPRFLDYWQLLESKLNGARVPQHVAMKRLHKARNNLKHAGNLPSRLDVDGFRILVKEFFDEACLIIFDLCFDDISLIDYVKSKAVRSELARAEELARHKSFEKASEAVAIAFQMLMDENLDHPTNPFLLNPLLSKARSAHLHHSSFAQDKDGAGLIRFANGIEEAIGEIRDEFRILASGLDYMKYARFRGSTPRVVHHGGGQYAPQLVKFNGYVEPDEEFAGFAIQFVIDSAIRIEA